MDVENSSTPLTHDARAHPKYRRDIDGLRAIAVLSVVVYHAFPEVLPGGFIGVDIFFVISGFLISRILLDGLADGSFSFDDFYRRRVKRIFPALIVVLATCALVGWFVLTPSDYSGLGKHILGGAAFVSNLLLWQESGYFDSATKLKPLLHLWSLGVEEQFYIVWPLALWLAWKSRVNAWKLTMAIIVISFLLNIWLTRYDATSAFYLPLTRFWELLIGAILAHASLSTGRHVGAAEELTTLASTRSIMLRNVQSTGGIACIVTSVLFLHEGLAFPGWWALLPVVGAYLLILAGPESFINRHILAHPAMVFIGLISYPLYLWHWPLLVFARISGSGDPSAVQRAALVALSIGLAWLTYRYVEHPVRFGKNMRKNVLVLCSLMGVMIIGGGTTFAQNGFESRFKGNTADYVNFKYDFEHDARVGTCWLDDKAAGNAFSPNCVDEPTGSSKPLIVVWGDSHAARLFPGLKAIAGPRFNLAQFTRNACAPFPDSGYENCISGNAYVLARIKQLRPAVVILFSHWTQYLSATTGTDRLEETVANLKSSGVGRVIVIGPAPLWSTPLPNNLMQLQKKQNLDYVPSRTTFGLDPKASLLDSHLQARFRGRRDFIYFSAVDAMCNRNGCLTRTTNSMDSITSWDYGHLTTSGSEYLIRALSSETNDFDTAH